MRKAISATVLLAYVASGCTTLTPTQRAEYRAIQAEGLAIEEKKPKLAFAMGLLPGGGSFYTRQWGMGALDLVLWPASCFWDPFVGYHGAEVINYETSHAYVKQLREKELADLDRKLRDSEITQAEFIDQRRELERKYDFD